MKYRQELPAEVEASLDAYVARIKDIQWFKPAADIKRENVDTAVKAAISAFGVKASIEYRQLKTPRDWGAAWGAARDAAWGAAWDAARDAARGAADILATHTKTYKGNTPFIRLVDIWEMGLLPVGVVDGKFLVYVSPCTLEFPKEL